MKYSLILPVYANEDSIPELVAAVATLASRVEPAIELLTPLLDRPGLADRERVEAGLGVGHKGQGPSAKPPGRRESGPGLAAPYCT